MKNRDVLFVGPGGGMADNEKRRRKTLLISMLVFLVSGGGIFLFFVIQGANDLTGAGKQAMFSYGYAVRDAVTPLFKALGVIPDDSKFSKSTVARLKARGLPVDENGLKQAAPDVSDWMAKGGGGSASGGGALPHTNVPHMAGSRLSGLGGGGGGSSKSSHAISRFGASEDSTKTTMSGGGAAGAEGAAGKGALSSLRNARSLLTTGLTSGSAMTAKGMWDRSFGVNSAAGGGKTLAYRDQGLVNLDKIKSGAIADLKMGNTATLEPSKVSDPTKDKSGTDQALKQDQQFQDQLKEKLAETAMQEAANAASSSIGDQKPGSNSTNLANPSPSQSGDSDGRPADVPKNVWDSIKSGTGSNTPTNDGTGTFTDTSRDITSNPDGTVTCVFNGTQTNQDGTKVTYSDTVVYGSDGVPVSVSEKDN